MKGLSGMKGNFHVPFLEEGERVIALLYSAVLILASVSDRTLSFTQFSYHSYTNTNY